MGSQKNLGTTEVLSSTDCESHPKVDASLLRQCIGRLEKMYQHKRKSEKTNNKRVLKTLLVTKM